jgi:hypothetical protein
MARTESDTLWVYRDGHQNMRIASSRPAGVASTEYRKVQEHAAGKQRDAEAEAKTKPAKNRAVPRLLDRAKSPAVKKGR